MTLRNVQIQQQPKRPLQDAGQLAQLGGMALTLAGFPVGGLISAGGTAAGMLSPSQQAPQGVRSVDTTAAVQRRMQNRDQDNDAILKEAMIALDEIELPDETKARLYKPLMQARQKGGFA